MHTNEARNGTRNHRALAAIPFDVDGQTYRLKLDHNALADVEEITGRTLPEILRPDEEGRANIGFSLIRAIFYAGTLPRLASKREAGDLVERLGMENTVPILERAVAAAFPEAEKPAEEGEAAPLGNGGAASVTKTPEGA